MYLFQILKEPTRFIMDAINEIISNLEYSTAHSHEEQTISDKGYRGKNEIIWSMDKSKAFFSDMKIVIVPAIIRRKVVFGKC